MFLPAIRQLRSIRSLLLDARRALITAFITSRLHDYCNATLYGVAAGNIHRLQIMMNAAARLVTDTDSYEHITPVLRDFLHWLPVKQRIIFKIAVLAFNCIRGYWPWLPQWRLHTVGRQSWAFQSVSC
jgi:hypothetical protein